VRTAFIKVLVELAAADERIWLLNADLGYSVLEPFRDRFPERYVNVGVAEQNMAGLAAGLAMRGKMPFLYSIANFPTLRCLEQIRNDICYHGCAVRVVSVGGGFTYGAQGYTHHGIEDLAVMRALPGMTVVAPGDPVETELAIRALCEWPGPAYLRLGKAGEPIVHETRPDFMIGRAIEVRDGRDATIITTGGMLKLAADACARLSVRGLSVRLLSMPTIKPLDAAAVAKAVTETPILLTVEEHSAVGGLGSAVADALLDMGLAPRRYRRLAVPDRLHYRVAEQATFRADLIGDIEGAVVALIQQ
jgi:transketolase